MVEWSGVEVKLPPNALCASEQVADPATWVQWGALGFSLSRAVRDVPSRPTFSRPGAPSTAEQHSMHSGNRVVVVSAQTSFVLWPGPDIKGPRPPMPSSLLQTVFDDLRLYKVGGVFLL